jgi:hypothetical protein
MLTFKAGRQIPKFLSLAKSPIDKLVRNACSWSDPADDCLGGGVSSARREDPPAYLPDQPVATGSGQHIALIS